MLLDCYRDTTSVPYGDFLIELPPHRDDRLRYCPNTGSFPTKFHIPERWKHEKLLADEHTKSLIFKCSNLFPTTAKIISFSLAQQSLSSYSAKARKLSTVLKQNLQSIKTHQVANFKNKVGVFSLKRTTWKQRRDFLTSENSTQLMKFFSPPIITLLSFNGTVCSRPCFCLPQKFQYPDSYEAGTSKNQAEQCFAYQVDPLENK